MIELIKTPLKLDTLTDEAASFVGSAQETTKRPGFLPGSEHEVTFKFPYVALSRDVWENLGMPTVIHMTLEDPNV